MKLKILAICILFISSNLSSQSISGNARVYSKTEKEASKIKYGNVEAYDKNNKLIRSVLTDEFGNYNIKFKDTGVYTIKIRYAGYKTITEKVHVTKDEKEDFSLKRDKSKKVRSLKADSYAFSSVSRKSTERYAMDKAFFPSKRGLGRVYYHKDLTVKPSKKIEVGLTSGEINDFAKWDMWNDFLKTNLKKHQLNWKLNPQKRFVVQIINQDKSPVVGARVKLIDSENTIVWESISDNTGKAELWGSITNNNSKIKKIKVSYKKIRKTIRNPTLFKKGINTLTLKTLCEVSNKVDIAFVVDATGSMSDEINFIKRDLNKIIYNSQKLYSDVSLRYGSVFYRDIGDSYVTKHKDFTTVLSESLIYIDEQNASGGGDFPEAVDQGLEVAINKLSWNSDARTKLLFLFLDAPSHSHPATIKKLENLVKLASKKGIKIIPVSGSGTNKSTEYLMRTIALFTNGKYVFLTNHSGIGNKHIEPTTDEYSVELLSKRLTNIIKNNIYYPKCEENIPVFDLNYPDSLVEFGVNLNDPLNAKDLLSTNDSTSIDADVIDQNQKIKWSFYPNPTNEQVTIEVSEKVTVIYLTDLSGKIMRKIDFESVKKKTIHLTNLPIGIYLLRVPLGKQWATGKLVLAR